MSPHYLYSFMGNGYKYYSDIYANYTNLFTFRSSSNQFGWKQELLKKFNSKMPLNKLLYSQKLHLNHHF